MHIIYLVRHAHAHWVSDENRPLSPGGQQDARRIADILVERPITTIYSSPYLRARQTVEPLAFRLGLSVNRDERLRERELGHWHAGSFEDAVKCTWQDMDHAFPGGESNHQAQARAVQWLREIVHLDVQGHILVGTHGNLLALLLKHYDALVDYEFWRGLSMPDIYRLEVDIGEIARYERLWES